VNEGAYLMDKIRSRCVEEGDCLLWPGAINDRGPVATVAQKQLSLRRVVWEHAHGRAWQSDRVASVSCENANCLNHEHIVPVTRSHLVSRTNKRHNSIARAARVAAGKRKSSKLSDAGVLDIRTSEERTEVLAKRWDVSEAYVRMLKRNEFRHDFSSPYHQLQGRGANA